MPKKTLQYEVRIQLEAIDDLDHIYHYILRDSPVKAKRFIQALKKKILALKDYPLRGTHVKLLEPKGLTATVRFIEYKKYLIFYTIDGKKVIVLHVTAPGKNWVDLIVDLS